MKIWGVITGEGGFPFYFKEKYSRLQRTYCYISVVV